MKNYNNCHPKLRFSQQSLPGARFTGTLVMFVSRSMRNVVSLRSSSDSLGAPISGKINKRHVNVKGARCPMKNPVTASLDASAALAVTQQAVAFAAVVGGEAFLTGTRLQPDTKGRPEVVATLIGTGGTVAAAVLVNQGESIGTVGCALGAGVAAYMLYQYAQRVRFTPYDPRDWPGEKAWPAVMTLISFFELAATFQGLMDGFNLLSS